MTVWFRLRFPRPIVGFHLWESFPVHLTFTNHNISQSWVKEIGHRKYVSRKESNRGMETSENNPKAWAGRDRQDGLDFWDSEEGISRSQPSLFLSLGTRWSASKHP